MTHKYHRSTIYALMVIMLLFALIFVAAILNLRGKKAVFNLGIPYDVEDMMLMVLSLAAIVRVLMLLIKIEHRRELNQRVSG